MSQSDCIFCKIIAGQIPCHTIYENDQVLSFLDIGPLSEGHTLVVPKMHVDRFDEAPVEVITAVAKAIGPIAAAVVSATGAEGYNILNNNGRTAGQLVQHLHFHIIPRRTGDGVFDRWPAKSYEDGRAEDIVSAIIERL